MATAVFFHAHPDDEAIQTGGTMAKLADAGHRVVLVTATRGELGETPVGLLGPGESLTDRRVAELAAACEVLGVARHEFLGYRDSGMAGEATNDDPACFWQTDVEEAAGRLEAILRDEGADVVVFYDENGGYGHPDHIQVHRVGMRAAERAGTPRAFMATVNRDYLLSLAEQSDEIGLPMPDEQRTLLEHLGVRGERVTTQVDVHRFLGHKRRAMEVHASQITDTSFFLTMEPEAFAMVWGQEWFIHVGAAPDGTLGGLAARTGTVTPSGGDGYDVPAVVAGEIDTHLAFLRYLRLAVIRKLDGVSDEDARRRLVASRTTLLGLVKHLTFVEAYWGQRRLAGVSIDEAYDGFDLDDTDRVATVCARYAAAGRRTDELVTACRDADHPLALGRHGLTVRWMLTHLIEETARHTGHADILRELLDGTGGR